MQISATMRAVKPLAKGFLTWIPGFQRAFYDRTAGGGTASARYCYGVWLKHLTLLRESGMQALPGTVVELGPGDSLGTGMAALLSGAERYVGIDAVARVRTQTNAQVFRDLVSLFQRRAPRPTKGWPDFDGYLGPGRFPGHILTDARLAQTLDSQRVAELAEAVRKACTPMPLPALRYCNWEQSACIAPGEAGLIFSHVVLTVIDDLDRVYGACARFLAPGGWMSHQLDFTSHGVTPEWNGHLGFSEPAWKIVAGRRPFFVRRQILSMHLELLEQHGFDVVTLIRGPSTGGLLRAQLAPRWRAIAEDDLGCSRAFLVARKRTHAS